MSAATITLKLGAGAVALPVLGFAIGIALQAAIPGCHCDEGAGCGGCAGLDGVIAFLMFGGFVGALLAVMFVLPASLLLSGLFAFFNSGNPEPRTAPAYATADPSLITVAIGRAISKFRENQDTQEICPTCMSRIQVTTNGMHSTSGPHRLSTACDCGACAGSFHVPRS
jgi:hypothetical protein